MLTPTKPAPKIATCGACIPAPPKLSIPNWRISTCPRVARSTMRASSEAARAPRRRLAAWRRRRVVMLLMSADYSVPRKRVKHELLALATEKKKLIVASSSNSRSSADTRRQTKMNSTSDRTLTRPLSITDGSRALGDAELAAGKALAST